MPTLRNVYTLLFIIGVFFIPFNGEVISPILGEYKREAAALFFFIGFFVWLVEVLLSKKLTFPSKSFIPYSLYIFLAWCLATSLLNYTSISQNHFKYTGGLERFFRQYFSLILSFVVLFFFFVQVFKKMPLQKVFFTVRKVFLMSLLFVFAFGLIEYGVIAYGIGAFRTVMSGLDYLPFIYVSYHVDRISSITLEPPNLAIYLITVAGFMFSYILTEKNKLKFIPLIIVLVLAFMSGSRTASVAVLVQFLFFCLYFFKHRKFQHYIVYTLPVVIVIVSGLFIYTNGSVFNEVYKRAESLNFKDNLTENVSNRSRFGIQYASLRVFQENPITGVGFGQQTYHNRYYYPPWATTNNYEFQLWYKNPNEPSFPSGYNLYTRLLSEVGIVGFLLFVTILGILFYKSYKIYRLEHAIHKIIGFSLLITFLGFSLNWFQIDSFRMFGFWIAVALTYLFDRKILIVEPSKNKQ